MAPSLEGSFRRAPRLQGSPAVLRAYLKGGHADQPGNADRTIAPAVADLETNSDLDSCAHPRTRRRCDAVRAGEPSLPTDDSAVTAHSCGAASPPEYVRGSRSRRVGVG